MINQNINNDGLNTGKTSVFNQLTGLNQQVGNYPGITVEKKLVSANYPIMLKKYIEFTW
jgi:ferrous iron transport protein B